MWHKGTTAGRANLRMAACLGHVPHIPQLIIHLTKPGTACPCDQTTCILLHHTGHERQQSRGGSNAVGMCLIVNFCWWLCSDAHAGHVPSMSHYINKQCSHALQSDVSALHCGAVPEKL